MLNFILKAFYIKNFYIVNRPFTCVKNYTIIHQYLETSSSLRYADAPCIDTFYYMISRQASVNIIPSRKV